MQGYPSIGVFNFALIDIPIGYAVQFCNQGVGLAWPPSAAPPVGSCVRAHYSSPRAARMAVQAAPITLSSSPARAAARMVVSTGTSSQTTDLVAELPFK